MLRFYSADQPNKGENEHKVVGEETEQLTESIVPVWAQESIKKVECVPKKDTAKDYG